MGLRGCFIDGIYLNTPPVREGLGVGLRDCFIDDIYSNTPPKTHPLPLPVREGRKGREALSKKSK